MLEIHEPVRLTMVIETSSATMQRIVEASENLKTLVYGGWLLLASLDPDTNELFELDREGLHAYHANHPLRSVSGGSREHYHGNRGHLPFVSILESAVETPIRGTELP